MSFFNNRTLHDARFSRHRPRAVDVADFDMGQMTAGQAEAATGGTLVSGSRNALISKISIDSRTIGPGELFFAIRGPNADGHDYLPSALGKGASGAVVDFAYEPPERLIGDRILLRVENTHQALKDLASYVREQWRGSLVAITGSVGKTTTKEFAAQVLQTEYSVYRSPGNYNNLFGLPLSLFGLSDADHIGIFEMGMSSRGEIAEMCRIARPDVGVITSVAPVHLEFFTSLAEIAAAKGELAESLGSDGTLVYNIDDPHVKDIAGRFGGHKISFGLSPEADVRAEEIEVLSLEETRFRVSTSGMTLRAAIPLAGLHYILNTLPAIALGRHYRIPLEQIIESLHDLRQAPMRGQILRFREGFSLIDDSYNSNPRALKQVTESLSQLACSGRRILIAGEMLELGAETPGMHFECGVWAARCGLDMVVAVKGEAAELARGALSAGMAASQVHFFPEADAATDFVTTNVQKGDLLLVKGSRGVHLEKIVEGLRSIHPEEES